MTIEKRIAITGIGPLASTGIGKEAFWKGILRKRTGLMLQELSIGDEYWDKFYVHKTVDFNISDFNIEEQVLDDIKTWKDGKEDRDLFYLLAAVKLAVDDSGISYNRENNNIGLFLTIEHPGFEPFCEHLVKETLNYVTDNPLDKEFSKAKLFRHVFNHFSRSGYDLQSFMYLFFLTRAFGFHGYSLFNNNACASGLFALESAARQIKYGDSDIILVAGGDIATTMFKHLWFHEQGFYADDGRIKPFSRNANGIVLGDGASALVLEELDHALKRGAHIYAEYLGGGFSLEGWKVTLPKIGSSSYQNSIESALKKSGLKPNDIDLINPHGVALKATDTYEAKAISDIFHEKPFVTAFKPYVGHNLGGSAIIESIILLLAMGDNVIPSTLNSDEIESKYSIRVVTEDMHYQLNTVMKLSCGFAGYNGAAIFRKYGHHKT